MSQLTLETKGDRQVVVTRRFAASSDDVFHAHTEARLIQQWLLGPDGWSMPVCICEPKPGGSIRYEWSDGKGHGFRLTGHFVEIDALHRIVHIERMHLPDPTPDNHVETTFTADGAGTVMVMTMTLPDETTRQMMLATGMDRGMEASYARLETQQGWPSCP